MKLDLDDQSLMFLALAWDDEEYATEVKQLIQTYQSLWSLNWHLNKKEEDAKKALEESSGNQERNNSVLETVGALKSELKRLLAFLSNTLLIMEPKDVPKGARRLQELQDKFEKILVTLGREQYREHARHSRRDYFLGRLLVHRLGLKFVEPKIMNEWYLVASMHDFCYILQDIENVASNVAETISKAFPGMKFKMDAKAEIGGVLLAEKQKKILESIATYEGKSPNNRYYFSFIEKAEDRDHGVMSALFVYDLLYREKETFPEDTLNMIARAIALHTDKQHSHCVVKANDDPLAALLILCDEIQEWKRPYVGLKSEMIDHIEVNNLIVKLESWQAEARLCELLLERKPAELFQIKLKIGDEEFHVHVSLKLDSTDNDWVCGLDLLTSFESTFDEKDFREFRYKTVATINGFADSLKLEEKIAEDDLNLKVDQEAKQIRGRVQIIGKMRGLPASAHSRVFDVFFSWMVFNYVNTNETERESVELQIEDRKPLEFHMPHLGAEAQLQKKLRESKVNNLRRIDYSAGEMKQVYEKILISSLSETTGERITLFPLKSKED